MMRWTVRGVSNDAADAVRDVAFETGSTLGDVVMLCVRYGLPEARRYLESQYADDGIDNLLQEIRDTISQIESNHGGPA